MLYTNASNALDPVQMIPVYIHKKNHLGIIPALNGGQNEL